MTTEVERWACGAIKQYFDKVCATCGVEFTSTSRKKKFCSRHCRSGNRPILDRFWARVAVAGPDDCWLWTGQMSPTGYGHFVLEDNGRYAREYAHRFSIQIATGQDARGWYVLHSCDNPPCVNPAHLRYGTQKDNMQDARERGRTNHSGLRIGQQMSTREARLRKAS